MFLLRRSTSFMHLSENVKDIKKEIDTSTIEKTVFTPKLAKYSCSRWLKGNQLLAVYTICASLSYFLIGYENGVMGGLVTNDPFLNNFNLSVRNDSSLIGIIVAIFDIGCAIGSLSTLLFAERIGRVFTMIMATFLLILGGFMQTFPPNVAIILAGRIISGVGIGILNSTAPILIAEVSPAASRGRIVCALLSTLNLGIMVSYWVDYRFAKFDGKLAWQIPIALQLVFIVALLLLLFIIPETPRWLALRGYHSSCLQAISQIKNISMDDQDVKAFQQVILDNLEYETQESGKWSEIFKNDRIRTRRRFFIACAIQGFQQMGGANAIVYYSGYIFKESVQLSPKDANLLSGFLFTFFFLSSFVTWTVIDKVGRRKLLLLCLPVMSTIFILLASLLDSPTKSRAIAATVFLFLFFFFFTLGFQAVVWVIQSEILPLRFRTKGAGISTATNWLFNFLVVQVTPLAIQRIGSKFYILFAAVNAVAFPVFFFYYNETAGLTLEEIDHVYSEHHVN